MASATLIKEVQRSIAVAALDTIYKDPEMSSTECKEKMFKLYHGDPSNSASAPYVRLLCEGRQQFKCMFDQEVNISTRADADDSAASELTLKAVLTQNFRTKISVSVAAGSDGKLPDLYLQLLLHKSKQSANLISPSTLWRQAAVALCNCKKALAISDLFLIDGELPSGTNWEDYIEHILA
jgi:hypothetical protein